MGFGLLSGLIGLLQVVGAQEGPLYFYNVTNNGSAVGLFSNRNHQAMFLACLFPMLSVFAFAGLQTVEQWRFRRWISIAAGLVIIPLLLVAGSRAGLLIGLFGLATVPLLYRKPLFAHPAKRKGRRIKTAYLFVAFGVVAIGLLTVLFARAKAFERLIAPDQLQDLRLSVWGPIAQMSWKYFPFGSGAGSFAEVYQIDEPLGLLSPSYLNHAHNDWLEVVMTTGGFGLILLVNLAIRFLSPKVIVSCSPNHCLSCIYLYVFPSYLYFFSACSESSHNQERGPRKFGQCNR